MFTSPFTRSSSISSRRLIGWKSCGHPEDFFSFFGVISFVSFENGEFTYNDNKYESYEITLSWDYKKDLGYDKKGKVTIIKIEDKLYVVSYEGGEK